MVPLWAAFVAPLSCMAPARALAKAVDTEVPVLALVECRAIEADDRSVASMSVKLIDPLSLRKDPVSVVAVLGLSLRMPASSVSAAVTSITVIVGESLPPLMVTLTSWLELAVLLPESSRMVMV